jgi:hypothetical protein
MPLRRRFRREERRMGQPRDQPMDQPRHQPRDQPRDQPSVLLDHDFEQYITSFERSATLRSTGLSQ